MLILTMLIMALASCANRHRAAQETPQQEQARLRGYVETAHRVCAPQKGTPTYQECVYRVGFDQFDRYQAIQNRHQDRLDAIDREYRRRQAEIYADWAAPRQRTVICNGYTCY